MSALQPNRLVTPLDRHQIEQYLPHRVQSLLTMRVLDIEPNDWIVGEYASQGSEKEPQLEEKVRQALGELAEILFEYSRDAKMGSKVSSVSITQARKFCDNHLQLPCCLDLEVEVVSSGYTGTLFAAKALYGELIVGEFSISVVTSCLQLARGLPESDAPETVDGISIDITKYQPFGEAFRFIDTAQLYGKSRIVCTYHFTGERDYQKAHFPPPGKVLMAGTLELEGLLQAAIILYGALEHPDGLFAAKGFRVKKASIEWQWPATKGKEIQFDVSLTRKEGDVWHFHGTARVRQHCLCVADFTGTTGK